MSDFSSSEIPNSSDMVSRRAAIDAICDFFGDNDGTWSDEKITILMDVGIIIANLPSAQPEQLTDKEQRIFLAAMWREEKVCEEVDRNYVGEPYEDSLMRVCKEIRRKVKGALWT